MSTAETMDMRRSWAENNANKIAHLLDSPSLNADESRAWKLYYWQDGDYLVATMTQNLRTQEVFVTLIRPYTRVAGMVGMRGTSTMGLQLAGQFSADEIVAFLRLDLEDDLEIIWHRARRQSEVVVPAALQQILGAANGIGSR